MKSRKVFAGMLAMVFGMAVVGCDLGTTNNDGKKTGILTKMDIAGATNLFIASTTLARSAGDTSANKLFKITEEGYVQEVTYTYEDDEGNPVTSTETQSPSFILVLNSDFLVISFGHYFDNYLVNTSTGACYVYPNDLPDLYQNKSYYEGEYFGEDNSGNIYFINYSVNGSIPAIKQLSVADANKITITTVSVQNDTVRNFGVDQDGNIAYSGRDGGDNEVLRYKKSSGGLEVLPGQT